MELDSYTILMASTAALVALGMALLFFWNRDRRSVWLLWWSLPFIAAGFATLTYARPDWQTDLISIVPGNAVRILALACLWQGARAFVGRKPTWLVLAAIPTTWMVICLIPGFTDSLPARVVLSSGGMAAACGLAGWEFWRGRAEQLPSINAIIVCFGSFTMLMLARVFGVYILPFPMGALPHDPVWVAGFNLAIFIHSLFLGLLLLSLTKERKEMKQREIALIDPLTGLMNRRAFMLEVERNAHRRGGGDEKTAVLVLDLDHFKAVNDRHGHDVGDAVLARFGKVAAEGVRPTDKLYRLGGEEFCFVLPDTDVQSALRVAERVRQTFGGHAFDIANGATVAVTVSIGVATADHAGFDLEVLLAAADAALYEAKSRGRNRIVVTDPALLGRSASDIATETLRSRAAG